MDAETQILPESIEKPFPGLTVEYYLSNQVILYRLTTPTPEAVENWAGFVLQKLAKWPEDVPYLAVHDLSQPGISLQYAALVNFDMMNIGVTIEGRMRAEQVVDHQQPFTARVAVNFNLSLSGQTNRTLMSYLNHDHPSIRYKSFYNRMKAIRWLVGDLKDTSETRAVDPDS